MPNEQDKNDFYNWVSQQKQAESPFFPTHPAALEEFPRAQLPKGKYEVFYRQFNLSDSKQVEALEDIVNKCLASSNWVLIREEWGSDQHGNRIVTIKYMHFTPAKKKDGAL